MPLFSGSGEYVTVDATPVRRDPVHRVRQAGDDRVRLAARVPNDIVRIEYIVEPEVAPDSTSVVDEELGDAVRIGAPEGADELSIHHTQSGRAKAVDALECAAAQFEQATGFAGLAEPGRHSGYEQGLTHRSTRTQSRPG